MQKKSFKHLLYSVFLAAVFVSCYESAEPPTPFGATPSQKQIDWQQLEYYMFIHFGPNTFTDVEWGDGKEDPRVFNPTNFDARQWAETAKNAGMKAIILTAKHHDGFCLWPSNYSTHTVRESGWRDGEGDVLREVSDACREFGLLFGVYLSPWDQNHPTYGAPEYNQLFANTLTEVLTQYGDIFEVWFDGANGNAMRGEAVQEYDWDLFHRTVYRNQPNALIFSDVGPDCRWMGNEAGIAGETNWSTLNVTGFVPGLGAPSPDVLASGNMNGEKWIPAETDVSIRPGWFYSPRTTDRVKSVQHLMDIWYTSVGRNSNLLLNIPPSTEGRIHPADSARLMEFRRAREKSFATDLIQGARITASNTRGNANRQFGVRYLTDGKFDNYWAADDNVTQVSFEIDFGKPTAFNRVQLQEYIPLGQRVKSFTVDIWNNETGSWQQVASETTIGYKRIVRFTKVTAQKLRVNINESLASPVLNGMAIFEAAEFITLPQITRNQEGIVTIATPMPDPVIFYTTDGTEPTAASPRFETPFAMLQGGVVKAVAMIDNNTQQSEVVTANFDIAAAKWTVLSPMQEDAYRAIDGNLTNRVLVDRAQPLVIDLGETLTLKGFVYTPFARTTAPNIYRYNFSVSDDNRQWRTVMRNALFDNIRNNPVAQEVIFGTLVQARYIRLEAVELANPGDRYSLSEVSVVTR